MKDTESLIAGNYNNLGKTKSVFQKIACESRQQFRLSKELNDSLLKLKCKNNDINCKVYKFIQDIGLYPQFIHMYCSESINIWHKLCDKTPYFDVTGSIVRKSIQEKKFLYYEFAI